MQGRFTVQRHAAENGYAIVDRFNGLPVPLLGRTLIHLPRSMAQDIMQCMEDVAGTRMYQNIASNAPAAFFLLPSELRHARATQLLQAGLSDQSRWADVDNLALSCDECIAAVAALISCEARVLDLGCGAMALERALPSDVTYLPADIVRRDERTLLFDANTDPLPDVDADVVTVLGLLEYVMDPRKFLKAATRWPRLILGYSAVDFAVGGDRRALGWINDLSVADLVAIANDVGFALTALTSVDPCQRIFDFRRAA